MKAERSVSTTIIVLFLLFVSSKSVYGFVERRYKSKSSGSRIHRPHPGQSPPSGKFFATNNDNKSEPNVLQKILDPYPTNIPFELKDEIYKAEGNTPAARQRTQRVITYGIICFVLVTSAFTNGFITELRHGVEGDVMANPSDLGLGWVESNGLFKFIFLNGLGGAMALFAGAASGMMAEAELDTRRQNAEKIYEELVRRRESKPQQKKQPKLQQQKPKGNDGEASAKKKQSGAQKKRLAALSEVIVEDDSVNVATVDAAEKPLENMSAKEQGLFGKLKSFYDKADSMAASQALLLNKELEDRGVIEKITDETGLKVIGREAAAKQSEEATTGSESNASNKT